MKLIIKIDIDWENKCEEFKYDLIGVKISVSHEEDWIFLPDEIEKAKTSLRKIMDRYYEISKL